jgi:hypothetical protein
MTAAIIWLCALIIATRCMCVAYHVYYSNSGRSMAAFGAFGYSYVLLALGALSGAAEFCGRAAALEGIAVPCLLIASAGLILTDRRTDVPKAMREIRQRASELWSKVRP